MESIRSRSSRRPQWIAGVREDWERSLWGEILGTRGFGFCRNVLENEGFAETNMDKAIGFDLYICFFLGFVKQRFEL